MRVLFVIVLLGTLGCEARLSLGTGCSRSSDCAAPLVCAFERCRAECVEQRDCPLGAMCLLDAEGRGTCSLPDDRNCSDPGATCPAGLDCLRGECVNLCTDVFECPPGSVCTSAPGERTHCVRPPDDDAGPLDAGTDAPRLDAPVDAPMAFDSPVPVDAPMTSDAPLPVDAPTPIDARDAPAAVDAGPPPAPPVLLAPSNGALTGSLHAPATFQTLRPLLRWLAPTDGSTVSYELEVDDSCATPGFFACTFPSPEHRMTGIAGQSYRPSGDLSVESAVAPLGRRYYWRVRACNPVGCSAWSPVRYLDVGRAPSDFNGDGYSDVVVGAFQDGSVAFLAGSVYVFDGAPAGAPVAPTLRIPSPAMQTRARFGVCVASAGDVNADGYADLVVGASTYDMGTIDEGSAFVFHGSSSGLPAMPTRPLDNPSGEADARFGVAVASAGDANGDGYSDVLVGAYSEDTSAADVGRAYLYDGAAGGLSAAPTLTFDDPSSQLGASFGGWVGSAGDLDGDGYSDLVISAQDRDVGAAMDAGAVFIYLGRPLPMGPSTTPSFTLVDPGPDAGAAFGWTFAGGDVDGDGYGDLAVGAYLQDDGGTDAGSVYVYRGGPSGVAAAPDTPIDGVQAMARFGSGVAMADLDADGRAEVVVGAYLDDGVAMNEGAAYVFRGTAAGTETTPMTMLENPGREVGGYFGYSVAAIGDVDGDGFGDVGVGAYDQDADFVDEGSAFVYRGSGSGLPMTPSRTLTSPSTLQASFGWCVGG